MAVTIFHNPKCTKSRETLQLLEKKGIKPEIRLYLEEPPTQKELKDVLELLGMEAIDLLRTKEDIYKTLVTKEGKPDNSKALAWMVKHPKLIERPIVLKGKRRGWGDRRKKFWRSCSEPFRPSLREYGFAPLFQTHTLWLNGPMANPRKRLSHNVSGDFYVDSTCINCDTCRQLAPTIFADDGDYSFVEQQPRNPEEERATLRALLACPTSSIGTTGKQKAREAMEDFPLNIAERVYLLGFNAENSFGANSYFIQHPDGNWMIDSPRFTPYLIKKINERGGVKYHFFSHSDDVADGAKYAAAFGSQRIIHRGDKRGMRDAEILLEGTEPVSFGKDFLVIPTPGHTRGHAVLLYKNKFLFTGDHLWFSRRTGHLGASRQYNWHSWNEQIQSMKKLEDFSFEWVLPGHGRQAHFAPPQMKRELHQLIEQMPTM